MAKKQDKKEVNADAARVCEEQGIKKVFINSKREFFTERSYAIASEGGDKTKVSCYEVSAENGKGENANSGEADGVNEQGNPAEDE